jgi:hypothetical protein
VAGGRRPGAAEPIVGIFCLPGFVADRGPICFSSGSRPHFFPHVRDRVSLSLLLSFTPLFAPSEHLDSWAQCFYRNFPLTSKDFHQNRQRKWTENSCKREREDRREGDRPEGMSRGAFDGAIVFALVSGVVFCCGAITKALGRVRKG